ncbi:OmpA family protein [Flavobacterium tructae]|uniref:OmpA family protein n=1 Tax=Flavobacterium TaxID=237 RepID=UPI00201F4EDE|nr:MULTISPECIES: OmpA family protein [Flavobacterium]MDL2144809.1 OmpA family protein [Flavobacterium tructae]URC14663.1 OmpA family protein [Flavobacterium sp. B183]
MKNYIPFYLLILSFFSFHTYSQKNKIATADKQYTNYAYINAIETYERVASKGYKSADMFKKLGNAFYFNAEFDKAAKWYDELFAMTNDVEPEYYYRYAQSLKSTNRTEKANQMLDLFSQHSKNDTRAKLYKKNENYLDLIKANSGRYTIEDSGINSKYSDYGTTFFQNKIVFTTARDTGGLGQQRHKWTGESFTNLYEAALDENFNPSAPKKIKSKINSKFHESTPTFTKDGTTVYFTRNNYIDGKKGKNKQKTTFIKIYKATLNQKKEWDNIIELPFNSNDYSTAHPTLSPDEKTLYFASDMPGTIGQSDIYKVKILSNGGYSSPQNLGPEINTEGKETFPFVTDENEIYFASDGHPGLGGLDVFVGKINDAGVSNIQNLGADINSPNDDFAYIIDIKSRKGFFSSNRKGGQGSDDIYKFLETKKINTDYQLYGVVTDLDSNEILPNAKITLYDQDMNVKDSTFSDEKGNYSFILDSETPYYIRAEKENYTTWEQKILVSKDRSKAYLPIPLEKSSYQVTIGDNLGKVFGIKMIYFDLDKSNIGKEAALDLEKILDVLNLYPKMKLDIRSHTDSRQTQKYNQLLSDRRAKSTIDWLIKHGVDKNRLTGKGYGETQLVNHCSDNENCTEEEHQMNRRSEFIISGL